MMSAREIVEKNYTALEEAFRRGDADPISLMYTDDAELFIPGAPVLEGGPPIHEAWKKIVGSGGNILRTVVREVQESGDFAYDTGHFTASAPNGSVLNAGKWIVVWKRQSSGEWKIHRDFIHWDIPPAETSTS
jgi:ketosteroid isomerase-like protein